MEIIGFRTIFMPNAFMKKGVKGETPKRSFTM
jgi:hypothetical protein